MSLSVGERLGPYEILAAIGAGGMGEVWKARDTRLNRVVAIKKLKAEHGGRFKTEAQAIAALNHPHICQIYDIGPDYLVLEYIEGTPFKGPLAFDEVVRLAIQITSALEEAHNRGVFHRDLKPANIILTATGAVKVLDFGLAKMVFPRAAGDSFSTLSVALTEPGVVVGTLAYMSPEQAQGHAVDARSDIFSLGVVLYSVVSGRQAFSGDTPFAIMTAIVNHAPPPLQVPAALDQIVRRCIAKQPSERFQTMAEVRYALQHISLEPPAQDTRASHLPTGVTSLIGRSRELTDIRDLLLRDDARLVNLTGPAGIGKTRLAIEVARQTVDEFEHTWFVELENVLEAHRVPSAILHGIGLREEDTRAPQSCLVEYLANRKGLLVLDNFEQVADAALSVGQMLASCPRLKILVTSRALMHLRAEHEYIVHPLNTGGDATIDQLPDIPAVALFLERAPMVGRTPETMRAIGEICERLDGIPLAIELAAARSKLLSPQAMLRRLRDRFQWLAGGARDGPQRQQTLRQAIDWSYDLLSPNEKILIQRLSVFVGGATIEAVEVICSGDGEMLDLLTALADKSLLVKQEDRNGNVRIRLLETIRVYSRERFEQQADAARVLERHAAYYLTLAEATEAQESASYGQQVYDSLEEDQGNCLAAVDCFLLQGEPELALRMVVALWPFWEARGYWTAGRTQLKHVLSRTSDSVSQLARAKALYAAGVLADAQGDYLAARQAFEEHLAILRNSSSRESVAAAMNNLGITALRQEDFEAARVAYLEALQILRSLDSQLSVAQCLNNLGHVAMASGDYATARLNYQESLGICRQLRSSRDIAWTLSNLGDVARQEGNFGEAEVLYSQSLGIFRQIGDQAGLASCMADLGSLATLRDEYKIAAQLYQESLVIWGDLGDRRGLAGVLEGFAIMASAQGNAEAAVRLAGAVKALRNNLGLKQSRAQKSRLDASISSARTALGSQAERVWEEGTRMSLEKAISYALGNAAV